MDEKKKGIILGTIALVAGIAMIAYGVINLMSEAKKEPEDTPPSNLDEPSITVTEEEVRTWLDDNKGLFAYLMDYNNDFDLDTATDTDISNLFGWYFVYQYDHGTGEQAMDSKYAKRYVMPKSDAEVFLQNYLGLTLDMVDTSLITLSEDTFIFTSDEENFYVEVAEKELEPVQSSEISKIEIVTDSSIKVTYGIVELGKTCEGTDDCYLKTREVILRKADSGFTILKVYDFQDENTSNNEENNDTTVENNDNTENNQTNTETPDVNQNNTDDNQNNTEEDNTDTSDNQNNNSEQ